MPFVCFFLLQPHLRREWVNAQLGCFVFDFALFFCALCGFFLVSFPLWFSVLLRVFFAFFGVAAVGRSYCVSALLLVCQPAYPLSLCPARVGVGPKTSQSPILQKLAPTPSLIGVGRFGKKYLPFLDFFLDFFFGLESGGRVK